jgi:hypothetical protein
VYCAIYPYSTTERTHVFEIYNDNRIEYFYGVRESKIDNEIKFKKLERRKTIRIKKKQLKQIKNYILQLKTFGNLSLEDEALDSLEILLITDTNRINMLYPPSYPPLFPQYQKQYKVIDEFSNFIKKITNIDYFE